MGTFGWDDEGVAAGTHPLVERGIFVDYLSSRETAARARPRVDRHDARRRLESHAAHPHGERLAASRREGSLDDLDRRHEGRRLHGRPTRAGASTTCASTFSSRARSPGRSRTARRTRILRDPLLHGHHAGASGARATRSADADEWKLWGISTCGKGDPMQIMQVGHGAAPARFRNVSIGNIGSSGVNGRRVACTLQGCRSRARARREAEVFARVASARLRALRGRRARPAHGARGAARRRARRARARASPRRMTTTLDVDVDRRGDPRSAAKAAPLVARDRRLPGVRAARGEPTRRRRRASRDDTAKATPEAARRAARARAREGSRRGPRQRRACSRRRTAPPRSRRRAGCARAHDATRRASFKVWALETPGAGGAAGYGGHVHRDVSARSRIERETERAIRMCKLGRDPIALDAGRYDVVMEPRGGRRAARVALASSRSAPPRSSKATSPIAGRFGRAHHRRERSTIVEDPTRRSRARLRRALRSRGHARAAASRSSSAASRASVLYDRTYAARAHDALDRQRAPRRDRRRRGGVGASNLAHERRRRPRASTSSSPASTAASTSAASTT